MGEEVSDAVLGGSPSVGADYGGAVVGHVGLGSHFESFLWASSLGESVMDEVEIEPRK